VSSGNLATVESRCVRGTAPLDPINRGLSLLKNFHRSHAFFRTLAFTFRRKGPRDQVFAASRLPQTFYGIAFFIFSHCFYFSSYLYFLFCELVGAESSPHTN
jgi:hypothetical protein